MPGINESLSLERAGLSSRQRWLLPLLGLLLAAAFRTEASSPLYYPMLLLGMGMLASVAVIPLRWVVYPLIILVLAMPDITQAAEEVVAVGVIPAATPWQFGIGPLTPAILVFGFIIVALVRLFRIPVDFKFKGVFVYFLVVATAISILRGYPQQSLQAFVIDFKVPLYFCTGIAVFSSYFRRFPDEYWRVVYTFALLGAGVFLLDGLRLLLGLGKAVEGVGYVNLSLDSGKGLILTITFFAIASISRGKNVMVSLLTIGATLYVLLAYQTRWLVVTFVLGLVMVLAFLGIRRALLFVVPLGIVISIAISLMLYFESETWRIFLLRFAGVANLADNLALATVDAVRAKAILNSMNTLWDGNGVPFGMGYGSWYSDNYVSFGRLTISAFSVESLQTRQYHRVHDFLFHFLFKFGVVGISIYVLAFARPIRAVWKRRKQLTHNTTRALVLVLVGLSPTVVTYMWWSGKGLFFCGLFVVIANELARRLPGECADCIPEPGHRPASTSPA